MNKDFNKETSINVEMKTFKDLLALSLVIPNFQRSYVWKEINLKKLINDLEEFLLSNKDEYYMGTLLLYKSENKEEYEIIDGQQRITTLTIFYNSLFNGIPDNFKIAFSSQESINNIVGAKKYFDDGKYKIEQNKNDLFEKLKFTVIITNSQDEAFTFFDTQNSRGVKLKAIDLLKAHHLRAINDNERQKVSAKKWENVENTKNGFIRKNSDFIDELFKYILYRARVWRGNKVGIVDIESSDRIQNEKIKVEFEKGVQSDIIQLYPHHKNMLVHTIDIDENEDYIMDFRFKQYRHQPKDLPFSLRQPISKGLEFFLFVEKYAQIVEYLNKDNSQILEYRDFYKGVINPDNTNSPFSVYLKEFFMLCVVCYYDKFEHNKLFEFSLWLEYLLGAVRIKQSMIVERTIPKTIRELPYNIVDIILESYTSDEIISYLQNIEKIDNENIDKIYSFEKISGQIYEDSIRDRYIKLVKKYYKQNNEKNLKDKKIWIDQRLKNVE